MTTLVDKPTTKVMKKIIVPTDFSKLSKHALDFAVKLAGPLKAEVELLHLEEVPLGDLSLHLSGEAGGSTISNDSLFNAQLFRANGKNLRTLSKEFTSETVTVTGRQFGGGFLNGMRHYIEEHGGDLVVIGTTGEESIQELFSGNHTEQLIEHLTVPVLSLQEQQFHSIEDIVLGLDLKDEKYTKKVFEMVKIISNALEATLHIVNVTNAHDDEEQMQLLNKVAKIVGLNNFMVDVIEDKHSCNALLEYAEGTDAGLIITLSEAKSGLSRFFQHSFATRMTKKSSIPVLTINKRHLV